MSTTSLRRSARGYSLAVVVAIVTTAGLPCIAAAAVVFSDNFNRANSSTIGNSWSESNPGGGDALIAGNLLDLESNNGNDQGNSFTTQATASFPPPAVNVLTNNPGLMTWTFNMQSSNNDLSGFGGSNEGIATVLVATGADFNTANGYAVVWGETGATDRIRLVHFTSGLDANANLANLITATGGAGTPGDPNANFMSVKVTYDPATDTFELFARSDGGASFADPLTGSYTSYGTVPNTTYTSATMTHVGFLAAYNQNNEHRRFDNLTIDVVPEPAALVCTALAPLMLMRRRR
jgi:hypothetical protein